MNPSQMNDPLLSYYLELAGMRPEYEDVSKNRATAAALRGMSQQPQGQMVGRTFVKSNPLEHLASLLGQGTATWKEGEADQSAAALTKRRAEALRRMLPGGMAQAMPMPQPGDPEYGYASPL